MTNKILIGAHRGAMCHAPENTLAAFEKAIEMGTYRIELDVRRCKDGHIVIMHDASVDRTTGGSGLVSDLTLEEMKRLRAGAEETVPTLREALQCAKGRCKLLIEIKETGMADDVAAEIAEAEMVDDCTVSSFLEEELHRIKQSNSRIQTAYFLTEPKPFSPEDVIARLGISLLVVWPRAATPEYIAAAKQCRLHVRCGLRDDLTFEEAFELFRRMADMGVDEIASGRPDWIGQMAAAYANQSHTARASDAPS